MAKSLSPRRSPTRAAACASANASVIRSSTAPSCARRKATRSSRASLSRNGIRTRRRSSRKSAARLSTAILSKARRWRSGSMNEPARAPMLSSSSRISTSVRVSLSKTRPGKPRSCRARTTSRATSCRSVRISTCPKVRRSSPATCPRETTKTKDITGGLPRVAERFEARKPKEFAVISEIDGQVSFGKDTKGKRKVEVTPEIGEKREYLIPKGKHIAVHEGDIVKAGEPLMEGSSNPHDILTILGEKALAKYLVDEIQEIYRLQGVRINDKHIEVIVRQMLRRVRIKEVGDTPFLVGDQVEKWRFDEENGRVLTRGGEPAIAEPLLLGITKASLSTESFISAASFQETTRVLTESAINGKVDRLVGLKENVIMGRLIPAGTGMNSYNQMVVKVEGAAAEEEVEKPELAAAPAPGGD